MAAGIAVEYLFASIVLISCGLASSRAVTSSEVKQLSDDYFDFKIRENPWLATGLGIDKYQDKIEEWNHAAFNRRIEESKVLLSRADSLLSGNTFQTEQDENGLRIMRYSLDVFLKGAPYRNYTVTLNGDLSELPVILRRYPIDSEQKLSNWYTRVIALQSLMDDQMGLLDQAISSRLTRAKYNVEEFIALLRGATANSTENFFAFKPWLSLGISSTNSSFYQDGLRECGTLRDKMINYTDKMENEYLPVARDENHEGVCNLRGGIDFYRNTLKHYTYDEITPEYAHELGLNETNRITAEMRKIVASQGFEGTIKEYADYLLAQPGDTFPTSAELLQGYKDMLKDRIEPKMSLEFDPADTGIDVQIEDDPAGSGGFYYGPQLDSETGEYGPGTFAYDGRRPQDKLKMSMLSLLLHETVPGHHYQFTYNLKIAPLPDYLRYYDYAHYPQDGFKFPNFTPYVEGWGLYSEYLGSEGMLGVIQSDKERLGQLSYESLRAARLVVDTGIHFYNWTRQRAEDYLMDSTTLSNADCVSQIRRYIRWPGQACAYKIGELKLKELRQTALTKLGDKFDPREFHNVILKLGPSPLEMVEAKVTDWISQKTITSSASKSAVLPITYLFPFVITILVKCHVDH